MLSAFPALEFTAETLPKVRAVSAEMMKAESPATLRDIPVALTEQRVPGPKGAPQVRVLVYRPTGGTEKLPAFLHIHGGGYVVGMPEMSDARNRELAVETPCVVVSVDYRLAPESPHPAPVEDCYAALKWMHANADQLGIDPRRIGIGGESAGGGLSAALALLARDRGEVPLVFQLLIYPMLDDRTCSLSAPHPFAGEFLWTPQTNSFGWTSLLGRPPGGEGVSPYAAAARAESLAGLPASFICTGALDLFLEEDMEYGRRLLRAGVPTEMHIYPGAFHGFNMVAEADVSKRFERDYRAALRRALYFDQVV
jgi:acetyl esterase/lipase